ncbi:MAG TPA: hydroxymethylbilane synthase [Solirubrobacterales bacterium]|jgi:hydroxymethylbilane synthase|nr:hydroxymethylbilane synthase [Solirubrobacterales bacterium]
MPLRLATRGSALALAQAGQIAEMLGGAELVEASSDGEAGDKARFVRGVERALLDGEAEVGVHSAKDLPGEMPTGLEIAAVPAREDPADVWIGAGESLEGVPEGARVGTASLRRRAQLLAARPDLQVEALHGNVDTRLRKLAEGDLDAIVLAAAGLRRLGREAEIGFAVPVDVMVPAAGQGALALQVRAGDIASTETVSTILDFDAARELTAERAAVALLDTTCASPIGVHARVEDERLTIQAFVGLPDGSEWVRDRVEGEALDPTAAGALLAERLRAAGARDILDRAEQLGAL